MSCIYCNSKYYGKGCLFSPTNTHVHMDAMDRCIYCGSKYVGGGCLFNPYGKQHIKGPEFLNRVHEQVKNSTILSFLYEKVKGINKNNFLTPLNRFYSRLSTIIANNSSHLLETFELQTKPSYKNITKEQFLKTNEVKKRLTEQFLDISKTIKHANLFLPEELVEEILVDAIISSNEHQKK
jgi:hypothetical protein